MLYKKYHRNYVRQFKKGTVIKKLISQGRGMYVGRISTDPEFTFTSHIIASCHEFITHRYSNIYLINNNGKLLFDIDNLIDDLSEYVI